MSLGELQTDAILQCMNAIAEGPFIEDWEMHTRLGIDRKTLRGVIQRWPDIDDSVVGSPEFLAVNNCMNEISNGLRIPPEEWNKWFTLTKLQIDEAYGKWSRLRANYRSGLR